MGRWVTKGACGQICLLAQRDEADRPYRSHRLRASDDGKSIMLIETDERKVGIQREYRFEITPGELIALIRAHGAELGENYDRREDTA